MIEQRRVALGLSDPLWLQYIRYIADLMRGNLGVSLVDGQSVTEMIARELPATAGLAIGAIAFASFLGITMGILAAQGTRSISTFAARIAINLSLSTPIYWTGTLTIYIFSSKLGLVPSTGAGRLSQLILPVGVLGFHTAGAIARLVGNKCTRGCIK